MRGNCGTNEWKLAEGLHDLVTVLRMTHRTHAFAIAVATTIAVLLGGFLVPGAADAAPSKRKPRNTAPVVCTDTAVTPYATPRARYAFTQLTAAGYSPAAAAGVVGYLDYRSALAPMALATDGTGYGIAQWPLERWRTLVSIAEDEAGNRWSPKRQIEFLITEMATNPVTFDSEGFKTLTDAGDAAKVFERTFNPTPNTNPVALSSKAQEWFTILTALPSTDIEPGLTNGIQVPCVPTGVSVDQCPMVPRSFKRNFANYTGYSWDRLNINTQRMSRCVYVNFPYITAHGTYGGHMPVWKQALDFFVPSSCSNAGGSHTNDPNDVLVGDRLTRYLIDNASRIGVDYVIWQDSIRNPREHAGESVWQPLKYWRQDNYNNGDCVNTHFDHVHASVYAGVGNFGKRTRGYDTGKNWGYAHSDLTPGLNPDGKPW